MTIDEVRSLLLWCTVINYGVLMCWFSAFVLGHGWMYSLHSRWFRISVERFDTIHYGSMGLYKVGVLLLNLVPLVALSILR